MKALGGIILLIGVVILAIPGLKEIHNNMYLLVGLITVVFGYILHIILNKKYQ